MDLRETNRGFDEDVQSGAPDSVLAGLFSQILKDLSVDNARFEDCVYEYARKISNTTDLKKISSTHGNIVNRFRRNVMTWNVFVKGISTLGVRRMEIALTVRTVDDVETVAAASLDFIPEIVAKDVKMKYSEDILPSLVGQIQNNLGIDGPRLSDLLRIHINECYRDSPPNTHTNIKNGFRKDLTSRPMSWKFLIRALLVFQVAVFDIDVRLTHRLKSMQTTHGRKVAIDQNYNP